MPKPDALSRFLDMGGYFIIKKEDSGMLAIPSVSINGKVFHIGVVIYSFADLVKKWDDIIGTSISAIGKKLKEKENAK